MLKILSAQEYLTKLQNKTSPEYLQVKDAVENIIKEVIEKGDDALLKYARDFDHIQNNNFNLRVSQDEIERGLSELSGSMKSIIKEAYENIFLFHTKEKEHSWTFIHNNSFLGQLVNPIEKAGVYVPGGKGKYPSSVLMNCVPAQIAGVSELYICTPPDKDGMIDPSIIYSAGLCGVKGIFKTGGAGAIAALAYGTKTIPKVYKITGPGNLYVTMAKKLVYGEVDIDMIAGPSEIMVLADENTNIDYLTYDLFSQSEHSEDASSIVLVPDKKIADKINLSVQEKTLISKRKDILTAALSNNGYIIIYSNLGEAYSIINEYAPEHLEVMMDLDFIEISNNIRNVGSIFVGQHTPEPIGDYFAGTNHCLPTNGTAKYFSPLGVYDFQKRTSIIKYSKERLKQDYQKVIDFAEYEGFYEHANSVRIRNLN